VVEFNGDGMMAVFGAPAPLVEKEHAAVTAGREIAFAVRSRLGWDRHNASRKPWRLELG
jgi:class 3 adenylate cyclase